MEMYSQTFYNQLFLTVLWFFWTIVHVHQEGKWLLIPSRECHFVSENQVLFNVPTERAQAWKDQSAHEEPPHIGKNFSSFSKHFALVSTLDIRPTSQAITLERHMYVTAWMGHKHSWLVM